MNRLETGSMGRKWQIQFWKAREGDTRLSVLHYTTSHKASSIKKEPGWETRGKASCGVKAAVLCFFWWLQQLLLVSESTQGH